MSTPSYLIQADSYNIAADADKSLFDTLGDKAQAVVDFTHASIAAGANEIYNIVPTVGNLFGADMEVSKLEDRLAEYDSNLAAFYQDHKAGVDIAGFIAGSFVPGLGATKAVNVGQTALKGAIRSGKFGAGMAESFGLQQPLREKYISQAIKEFGESGSPFKLTETNTLKALGAGLGDAALNSFAVETAIAATMHNSPILDQMDIKDLASNVMIGTAIGGGLGGIFAGVGTVYRTKKAIAGVQQELRPWAAVEAGEGLTPVEKALNLKHQLEVLPEVPEGFAFADRAKALRQQTIDRAWLDIRSNLHAFAGKDQELAQVLEETLRLQDSQSAMQLLLHSKTAGRVGKVTQLESELKALDAKVAKDISSLSAEEYSKWANTEVSYFRVHGEGMGSKLDEKPSILSVTDRFNSLEAKADGIYSGGKKIFTHENNPHRPYNIFGLDHYHTESRYIWAERLPKWSDKDAVAVHATDLPLLEKAWRDLDNVLVIPEGKTAMEAFKLSGKQEIEEFIKTQKSAIAQRMTVAKGIAQSPEVLKDKLQSYFGITINVVDDPGFLGRWTQQRVNGTLTDSIELSLQALRRKNIMQTVHTLEHERGHSMYQAMLRGITAGFKESAIYQRPGMPTQIVDAQMASVMSSLIPEMTEISKRVRGGAWKAARSNVAQKEYLTQPHELMADSLAYFAQHPDKLDKFPFFKQYAGHLVKPIPQEIKDALAVRAGTPTQEEIAKIVNVRTGHLTGAELSDMSWRARDSYRAEYFARQDMAGTRKSERLADPLMLPQHFKVLTDTTPIKGISAHEVDGIAFLSAKQKLFEESARRVATANIPELADMPAWSMNRVAASTQEGPGMLTAADAAYGTAGSMAAYIGQRTHNLIRKAKDSALELLNPIGNKLGSDLNAAVEFSVLNEKLRMSPYRYILDAENSRFVAKLEQKELAAARALGDEWVEIPIKNANTLDAWVVHNSLNTKRMQGLAAIHANNGNPFRRDIDAVYPIPRNPRDTPHFAFVVDDSITGVGHSQMLYAKDDSSLQALIQLAKEQRPDLRILTKAESEEYFKSRGQFNFERAINEKLIDVTKLRGGTSASALPKTDPAAIVRELTDWHMSREANYVRENVSHIYAKQFASLQAAGESATMAAKSKFGYVSPMSHGETAVDDPSLNVIRLALDFSKKDQMPIWNSLGEQADKIVSNVTQRISSLWRSVKSENDLEKVNAALKEAGYGGPLIASDAMYRAINESVPRGALSSFVNKANAIISTFALRLDPLNAINNAVGAQVLLNTELRSIISAIQKGDKAVAGELADLAYVTVPGAGKQMLSPGKMIAKAISDFHNDRAGREWAKKHGFTSSIMDQYDQSLDIMAQSLVTGKLGPAFQKAKDLADKGEMLTGNRIAEEFNRYIAANVMKQITDLAEKAGVIKDSRESLSYINTFVNRTQGNYLASQRPLIFQGPVGQAIGLFQTYQFNFIQQLLRHVGDKDAKALATMMGLQASIYGMQGLPAFNAINTHIIGNAPGNSQHTDIYKSVYETAGKEAGDWIMYGAASNALGLISPDLKNNIYVRGDINPRHLFVIPTSPADVPIANATARVFGNILDTAGNLMKGADVSETLLRGLEHNALNRPLAGLAQVLSGAMNPNQAVQATNAQGNILMAHDLANLASLTRLAGGKPLDEALTQDAMFRFNAYRAKDRARRDSLGEALKMNILAGGDVDPELVNGFAESYVKSGGKQTEFSQWMARQYRNATTPQADQLRKLLTSPYASHLQAISGGMRFMTASEVSEE